MFKSYTVISLSLVLTLSILVPAILSLMNDDCITVLVECDEEDFEEQEIETSDHEDSEEERSTHFMYISLHLNNSLVIHNNINTKMFINRISSPAFEIQLPPPENNI